MTDDTKRRWHAEGGRGRLLVHHIRGDTGEPFSLDIHDSHGNPLADVSFAAYLDRDRGEAVAGVVSGRTVTFPLILAEMDGRLVEVEMSMQDGTIVSVVAARVEVVEHEPCD